MATNANIKLVDANSKFCMFFLPKAKIYLTNEAPGPVLVDLETLSDEDLRALRYAIMTKQVESDIPISPINVPIVRDSVANGLVRHDTTPVVVPAAPILLVKKPADKITNERQKELVTLLGQKLFSIYKDLKLITNLTELDFLYASEKRGKKRKSILNKIIEAKREFEDQVQEAVKQETDFQMPKKYRVGEELVGDISEDESEEIELTITENIEDL